MLAPLKKVLVLDPLNPAVIAHLESKGFAVDLKVDKLEEAELCRIIDIIIMWTSAKTLTPMLEGVAK